MKKYTLVILTFFYINFCFAQQTAKYINSYEELMEFQYKMLDKEAVVFVWGHYEGWSKYWEDYKNDCVGVLNNQDFSKISSKLDFSLFNSAIIISQPFKDSIKVYPDLKKGDVIKLKIRLYKFCKYPHDELFFLIEDLY
jgi:hypothetical protein